MSAFVHAGPTLPQVTYLSATNTVTTSSSTFSVISGMTVTPPAGTYIVIFTGTMRVASNNADGEFAIFVDSTQITESTRRIFTTVSILLGVINNSIGAHGTPMAKITVDGREAVSARFRATGGTMACDHRTMVLMEVI